MDQKKLAQKRIFTYIAVFLGLFLGYLVCRNTPFFIAWRSSSHLHTILEVIATFLAMMVGVMALTRFYVKKTTLFLFIGAGFLGTALLDGYHTLVTSEWFIYLFPSPPSGLIPWSWLASRIFLAVAMFLSWFFCWRETRLGEKGKLNERIIYIIFGVFTFISFLFFAFVPLPSAYQTKLLFPRPQEFIPAFFFLLALIGYLRKGQWKQNSFEHWVILSLIVGFLGQISFMSLSSQLYDFEFDAAHFLKKISYICVLIGLFINMSRLFFEGEKGQEKLKEQAEELKKSNVKLETQTIELETERGSLEKKVEERTAELEKLKTGLEQTVAERTKALEGKLVEIKRVNKLMIDRELRMAEMKKEIEELRKKLGEA